jgi:uncharacterized protein YcbX
MKILQLWCYPVKSMQGQPVESCDVTGNGLQGDRGWALRDNATGLTLTARRAPELLFAHGMIVDGRALVRLPDGTETDSSSELSAWLGRDVDLISASDESPTYEIASDAEDEAGSPWRTWSGPGAAFHDSARARVSVIGEETLRDWPVRRFRPNILVSGGDEDGLVGSSVTNGEGVVLDVVKQIDRCVMITRPQPDGIERALDILRTVNRERGTFLGVGALVASPGSLTVGDELVPTATR